MDLDGRMVMGFVLYCSHENNLGLGLGLGRIFSHLKTADKRIHFKKSVEERGMYATLVRKNIDLMVRNKESQYSASEHPKHNSNYRGGTDIPILGDSSLGSISLTDSTQNVCILDRMDIVCQKREKEFVALCNEFHGERKVSGGKRKRGSAKNEENDWAKSFLKRVQELGGKGIGHMFSLNFVQFASVFGFIPVKLATWSSIENPGSGGYKFIQHLYGGNLDGVTVQSYFEKCVETCQGLYGPSVTKPIIENVLCKLWRSLGEKTNTKVDCYYGYSHRKCKENPSGAQCLFRLKMNKTFSMSLEMRSPKCFSGRREIKHKHSLLSFNGNGTCADPKALARWEGLVSNTITCESLLICSDLLVDIMK